jgi:hypothetical protein
VQRTQRRPFWILHSRGQKGVVLIELIVAALIFALVFGAFAYYFVFHLGTMKDGNAQLKLQRTGTFLMEAMAQAIRPGRTTDLEEGLTYNDLMITYPDDSTRCFSFDDSGKDIDAGPDYANLTPIPDLDDSQIVGTTNYNHRILCDDLRFMREGAAIIIRFTLRHDLDSEERVEDDLTISFGSTVKLRG